MICALTHFVIIFTSSAPPWPSSMMHAIVWRRTRRPETLSRLTWAVFFCVRQLVWFFSVASTFLELSHWRKCDLWYCLTRGASLIFSSERALHGVIETQLTLYIITITLTQKILTIPFSKMFLHTMLNIVSNVCLWDVKYIYWWAEVLTACLFWSDFNYFGAHWSTSGDSLDSLCIVYVHVCPSLSLWPGSEYLALQLEVNVNARANARIELGSILAFVVRLHWLPVATQDILNQAYVFLYPSLSYPPLTKYYITCTYMYLHSIHVILLDRM